MVSEACKPTTHGEAVTHRLALMVLYRSVTSFFWSRKALYSLSCGVHSTVHRQNDSRTTDSWPHLFRKPVLGFFVLVDRFHVGLVAHTHTRNLCLPVCTQHANTTEHTSERDRKSFSLAISSSISATTVSSGCCKRKRGTENIKQSKRHAGYRK